MSVTAEFKGIVNKIWNVVDAALLNEVGQSAKEILQDTIYRKVYTYPASYWALNKRRYDEGGLGDTRNMIASVVDVGNAERTHELQIEDFAGFQDVGPNFRGGFTGIGPEFNIGSIGARADEIVETGDPAWRQPYPRPFYQTAEKTIAESGVVEGELAAALIRAGFELY